jgi:hypothetical protein
MKMNTMGEGQGEAARDGLMGVKLDLRQGQRVNGGRYSARAAIVQRRERDDGHRAEGEREHLDGGPAPRAVKIGSASEMIPINFTPRATGRPAMRLKLEKMDAVFHGNNRSSMKWRRSPLD